MKRMVGLFSIAMFAVSSIVFAGGGHSGGGVQAIEINRFHTSGMNKKRNMLNQGDLISVTYQGGVEGAQPVVGGNVFKVSTSKASKSGGMVEVIYEAVGAGYGKITLANGAIYRFNVKANPMTGKTGHGSTLPNNIN